MRPGACHTSDDVIGYGCLNAGILDKDLIDLDMMILYATATLTTQNNHFI